MNTIQEMTTLELAAVAGGNPAPGQSWVDYLNDRFPGGEWDGNSFFPNGKPSGWP
ncbi:hypothetical protein [Altererythrobacter sp. ZODW24]|uniref:hypothetical protein n=1 Tax=Altererythrobacter sp. ZODW24 TaxID=2185142 RepID=UPI0013B4269C|nr:hypothetical protein [Altererythrobacter sp. ZODW24]